jgi:hypothetical protein
MPASHRDVRIVQRDRSKAIGKRRGGDAGELSAPPSRLVTNIIDEAAAGRRLA